MGQDEVKARRPVRVEAVGRKPLRSHLTEQGPRGREPTMHMDAPVRKAAGRLSREDQRRLGDILQRVYDDVVRQGVPDRFKHLLDELDGSEDPQGQSEAGGNPAPDPVAAGRAVGDDKGTR